MADVCCVAGFALQFVDAAFVVVGCRFMESGPGLLLYRVCASESYFNVCLFEKVHDFPDFMAVVCEGGPLLGFVVGIVGVRFLLCMSFQSCYEVDGEIVVFRYGEDLLPFGLFPICCEGK